MCADCPRRLAADLDDAFPRFVAHHRDLVYGIALRSTRRPADAEDLSQDAFIRSYRALAGYDPARIRALRARGWLAAIVANLARDRARRSSPPLADLDSVAFSQPDGAAGPAEVAERRDAARAWQRRLDQLPARYRRAVELRHVSGLSYPELAEAMGRPVGSVKSDVHRGVRLLRAALEREAGRGSHEATR